MTFLVILQSPDAILKNDKFDRLPGFYTAKEHGTHSRKTDKLGKYNIFYKLRVNFLNI